MAKRDFEFELAKFLVSEHVDLGDIGATMQSLPASVDASLAARAVVKIIERDLAIGKVCKRLPVPVIRSVLDASVAGPTHLFLRLAVPSDARPSVLVLAWQRALAALVELHTDYKHGEKIAALAKDPVVLHAIQGTVAHTADPSLAMLAVLVTDGSDASFDALVPHFDPALVQRDIRLDRLARLRPYAARTPAFDSLFAQIDRALDERRDGSPALALGPVIGLGSLRLLWFTVKLSSRERNRGQGFPRAHGQITVDSREATWFEVSISTIDMSRGTGDSTRFDATGAVRDGLKLGSCEPENVPAWLVKVAKQLKVTWSGFEPKTNLRGAKRDCIAAWLAPPKSARK